MMHAGLKAHHRDLVSIDHPKWQRSGVFSHIIWCILLLLDPKTVLKLDTAVRLPNKHHNRVRHTELGVSATYRPLQHLYSRLKRQCTYKVHSHRGFHERLWAKDHRYLSKDYEVPEHRYSKRGRFEQHPRPGPDVSRLKNEIVTEEHISGSRTALMNNVLYARRVDLRRARITPLRIERVHLDAVEMAPTTSDLITRMIWLCWSVLYLTHSTLKNPGHARFFPTARRLKHLLMSSSLEFAPGLLGVLQSTFPPTVSCFKTLPYQVQARNGSRSGRILFKCLLVTFKT